VQPDDNNRQHQCIFFLDYSRFIFIFTILIRAGVALRLWAKGATTCSEIALNKSVAQSHKSVAL
jgi:hypothetical protein